MLNVNHELKEGGSEMELHPFINLFVKCFFESLELGDLFALTFYKYSSSVTTLHKVGGIIY